MEAVVNRGSAAPDRTAWQGRRVFLTGHTGFKGSWMALWLQHLGADVCGYALPPGTTPSLFDAARVSSAMQSLDGNINDLARLRECIAEFQPEIILHFAAQALVRESYEEPLLTYTTNVLGTANVLQAARETPSVKAVLCVTSDKCYENAETHHAYVESDSLGGYDPYSSSKACAELVAAAYRQSFLAERGCAVGTARAGNVIGGGDWSRDRLVPDLIRGFRAHEAVLIRRPNSVRPWQHVLEPLCGYLLLAERLLQGDPAGANAFNFGPSADGAWAVHRIADHLAAAWGDDATWTRDTADSPHEAGLLLLNSDRARRTLHWQPVLTLPEALDWTAGWYRAHADGADMHAFTLGQIEQYEAMLISSR